MPAPRVPIVETFCKGWADAFRAAWAMPVAFLCAMAILAAMSVTSYFSVMAILLNPGRTVDAWLESPTWFVFQLFNGGLQIVLLAPLAIAIQRYVVRHDAARFYPLHPLRPSYLSYVGTALVLYLAYRLPDLISILAPGRRELPLAVNIGIFVLTFALIIAVVIVALRKIALFPAIAVNAPNAAWRSFVPADAGNTFRTMLVMICILLPVAICGRLLHDVLPMRWPGDGRGLATALIMAALQLPAIAASAAAIARIYLTTRAPAETPVVQAPSPAAA
jgi:hypothetical protein